MTKNNKNNNHSLHKLVGDCVEKCIKKINKEKHVEFIAIKDPAVGTNDGKKQYIPLFSEREKSNAAKYCNVDLIIIKDDKVFVIIEIEESDIKPTQICGKFLTSALSNYYIYNSQEPIGMNENVLFIQILDGSKLKKNRSTKYKQAENLIKDITSLIERKENKIGNITRYELIFYCKKEDNNCEEYDCEKIKDIENVINDFYTSLKND